MYSCVIFDLRGKSLVPAVLTAALSKGRVELSFGPDLRFAGLEIE